MTIEDLSGLAVPGARLAVRVTPRAARVAVRVQDGVIRVHTNAPPADGAANATVRRLLAEALGVAPTRLTLLRGASSRDKKFGLD